MEVKNILWISHPAFPYNPYQEQKRVTKTEINAFIEQLMRTAERMSKKEGTIVVLLKSFNFTKDRIALGTELGVPVSRTRELLSNSGIPRRRTRIMDGIEKRFERNLRNLFGTRLIVVDNKRVYSYDGVAKKVEREIARNRFVIGPKTRIFSAGSYLGRCTVDYPSTFGDNHRLGIRQMKKRCFPCRKAPPRTRK